MMITCTTDNNWDYISWSPYHRSFQVPRSWLFASQPPLSSISVFWNDLLCFAQVRTLRLETRTQVRRYLVHVAKKITVTLTSALGGFHQMWQGNTSLQVNHQYCQISKASNLSIKDRAEMAPVLSPFKSLPSQLSWLVEIVALSLTSESAENSHFPFAGRHNEWLE